MLVKVNGIDTIKNKVKVTELDIDNYGSVIPLKELELYIPADDKSIIETLRNSVSFVGPSVNHKDIRDFSSEVKAVVKRATIYSK